MKKLLVTFCLSLLTACASTQPVSQDGLLLITDTDMLKDLIETNYNGPIYYDNGFPGEKATDESSSQTNTQVAGVDESDVVKTNGTVIAMIADGRVILVDVKTDSVIWDKSYVSDPVKEGEPQTTRYPNEIFLDGNILMIFGSTSTYGNIYPMMEPGSGIREDRMFWPWYGSDTFIEIYQLNKTTKPSMLRSFEMKGTYYSARLTKDELILLTHQNNLIIYDEKGNEVVVEPTIKDLLNDTIVSSIDSKNAYVMPGNVGNSFVNIMKLDLDGYATPKLSSFLGWTQTIYMNEEDLVLSQNRWLVDAQGVGSNVTDFLRFDVKSLKLEAQGSTLGTLLNQFSMDIYQGIFRAALTNWDKDGLSVNRVAAYDASFNLLSSVEGLAKGETIRSVRFIKDKAYVVTFRNIDPLFVIDMSNARDIRLAGELKVPGFSTYLHSVNEDVLFGIAEDLKVTEETIEGRLFVSTERLGIKISLFNVSNPTKPIEVASLNVIGPNGYTESSYNHKALVLDDDRQLIYFPYSDYSAVNCEQSYCQSTYESGIKVVEVTPNSLRLVETIKLDQKENEYRWISRSVYVGDKLYLISANGLVVYNRSTYQYLHTIEF